MFAPLSAVRRPAAKTHRSRQTLGNPALGDVEQVGELTLTSPAFEDGQPIPEKYGRDAANVNPPLSIANVPPATTTVPEGWTSENAVEGTNDVGSRGYGGPAPPDGTHTCRFKLYALDTTLDLQSSASKQRVGEAMQGAVVSQTRLEGTDSL